MARLIVNEAEYKGGLFPKIPSRVPNQDTLLIGVDGIPRLVTDYLTVRDIRKGNFNKVVRISTVLFSTDVSLKAVSGNAPFQFEIKVGVECKVYDSAAYYMSHTIYSLEDSVKTALSRIVTPEAKRFELTDNNASAEMLRTFENKGEKALETLGVKFSVVSVDANPDADAERFVREMSEKTLNVRVQRHGLDEGVKLTSRSMEDAIMAQVADGKLDMEEAITKLRQTNRSEGYNSLEDMERVISFVRKLQTDNIISDDEAGQRISEFLKGLPGLPSINNPLGGTVQKISEKLTEPDTTVGDLLGEGDE